jgi:4a-hydroxytetrahydrobiopterin dehydratase
MWICITGMERILHHGRELPVNKWRKPTWRLPIKSKLNGGQKMNALAEMKCVPCRGDEPTVTEEEMKELKSKVPDWEVIKRDGVNQLERLYKFDNFAQALAFTNKVGEIAEEEQHHPVLVTEWGKVTVTWWTHKIGGLHNNDFVMAAKTDNEFKEMAVS